MALNFSIISATTAFATPGNNNIGENMISQAENKNVSVYETDDMIVDLVPVPRKTTTAVPKSGMRLEGFDVTSSILCHDNGWLGGHWDVYVVVGSEATRPIDYIYAKARSYDSDGVLMDTDSNSETNSSFVSATADYIKGSMIFDNDSWGLGNHTYRESGFKDIIHETKDEW